MMPLYPYLRSYLFQRDPEATHEQIVALGLFLQRYGFTRAMVNALYAPPPDPSLAQTLWGQTFENPVGLAAGFDKNIRLVALMRALGFGFLEVGSVSAQPWAGNPKPRVFRLPEDEAIINRMGLNNWGLTALTPRLQQLPRDWPVGISLVKTPDPAVMGEAGLADFRQALRMALGHGRYLALNISCPNTEEGKTFEDPEALDALLTVLREEEAGWLAQAPLYSPKPWLLKLSPDLDAAQVADLFAVGMRHRVAGWVVSNTSSRREGLSTAPDRLTEIGRGGLSGRPIAARSTRLLSELYQMGRADYPELVYIGVGGVRDAESAWAKITHGATLVQVYTGLIYEGPALLRQIQQGLLQKMAEQGYRHISEAIGSALR